MMQYIVIGVNSIGEGLVDVAVGPYRSFERAEAAYRALEEEGYVAEWHLLRALGDVEAVEPDELRLVPGEGEHG